MHLQPPRFRRSLLGALLFSLLTSTTPGLTGRSQVPRMFAAAGIPYPELLDVLVQDALAGAA